MAIESPACEFGQNVLDFKLKNVDDKDCSLQECLGEKGILVAFICNHCSYVHNILDNLVKDCDTLQNFGINTVAINSNDPSQHPEESFENMKQFAAKHQFPFPYLVDDTQKIAKAYGAVCTPDFLGYNADGKLQYRGRLLSTENKPVAYEYDEPRRELYDAMKQIAETGKGPKQQYPNHGCPIKWKGA